MRLIDLTGQRFGRLVVLGMARSGGIIYGRCKCDCGALKRVRSATLRRGTKSCGCLAREIARAGRLKHGDCIPGKISAEWTAWHMMHHRCVNPTAQQWRNYGARGIKVCRRWNDFKNFLADIGRRPSPGHSLDRYPDNDGDYKPSNCRWATRSEQAKNRRPRLGSNNSRAKLCDGDVRTIRRLLKRGIPQGRIASRVGITQSVISTINTGKSWSHVT